MHPKLFIKNWRKRIMSYSEFFLAQNEVGGGIQIMTFLLLEILDTFCNIILVILSRQLWSYLKRLKLNVIHGKCLRITWGLLVAMPSAWFLSEEAKRWYKFSKGAPLVSLIHSQNWVDIFLRSPEDIDCLCWWLFLWFFHIFLILILQKVLIDVSGIVLPNAVFHELQEDVKTIIFKGIKLQHRV